MGKRAAVQDRSRVSKKSKPVPSVEVVCMETTSTVDHSATEMHPASVPEKHDAAVEFPTTTFEHKAVTEQAKILSGGKSIESSSQSAQAQAEILQKAVSDFEQSLVDAADVLQSRLSKALEEKAALDSRSVSVADLRANAETARRKANDNVAALAAQKAERTAITELRRECQAAQDLQLAIIRDGATVFVNGIFEKPTDPKHVDVLMVLFEKIGLNDTLVSSFPAAAAKMPVDRTGFMHTVLSQAEQDLLAHIASLDAKLAAGDDALGELETTASGASAAAAEALLEDALGPHAAQSAEETQEAAAAMEATIAHLRAEVDATRRSALDFVAGPAAALRDWCQHHDNAVDEAALREPCQHHDTASCLAAAVDEESARLGGA